MGETKATGSDSDTTADAIVRQYQARIAELDKELASGQTALEGLKTKFENVQRQMLRIEGAKTVLTELLKARQADVSAPTEKPE
jgi:uncharacterized coiled-coil protein SlyX